MQKQRTSTLDVALDPALRQGPDAVRSIFDQSLETDISSALDVTSVSSCGVVVVSEKRPVHVTTPITTAVRSKSDGVARCLPS